MADTRNRGEMGRTAAVLATLYNCHRDPKHGRAATVEDFLPAQYRPKPPPITKEELRAWFVPNEADKGK